MVLETKTRPDARWVDLFTDTSAGIQETELFFLTVLQDGRPNEFQNLSFPETREGAWGIVAFDDELVYKLFAGKRKDREYRGYDRDTAEQIVREYHQYSGLITAAGITIPDRRSIELVPHPLDNKRVCLLERQRKIPGVSGLSLLRRDTDENISPFEAEAIFGQILISLIPVLKNPCLGFGLDPHPANFIFNPKDLSSTPIFIDLLPPRPKGGIDHQEHLRPEANDFYKRRLHLLYDPAGIVKYIYNAFAVAVPAMSQHFEKLTLEMLEQHPQLYKAMSEYFSVANLNERAKDWGYMQRIFRAIGRPEKSQSFRGNAIHLNRLPYYFIPPQVIADQRLDDLSTRHNFWSQLIQKYLGDSWSNDAEQLTGDKKPRVSINMIINQKRAFNLQGRIDDFERFKGLIDGDIECVITIGSTLTTAVFDEIKKICRRASFPITILVNKSPNPNISRNLTTVASRGEVRFVVDDDCYVPSETFRGLYDRLDKNSRFIAVGAISTNPDGEKHKPEKDFPVETCNGELLVVPGVHGMAIMIRGHYMDKYPIPPRIGRRGDWLPFFSLLQGEGGICAYDLSLPPIQHRFEISENNLSITRRSSRGLHAMLSMMQTLYETGSLLRSGSVADLYLREHYLGGTLEGALQSEWLSVLWNNLKKICTEPDSFSYDPQQIYEQMMDGINPDDLGRKNSTTLRWAGKLFLGNKNLVVGSKELMLALTSNRLQPPFQKFN